MQSLFFKTQKTKESHILNAHIRSAIGAALISRLLVPADSAPEQSVKLLTSLPRTVILFMLQRTISRKSKQINVTRGYDQKTYALTNAPAQAPCALNAAHCTFVRESLARFLSLSRVTGAVPWLVSR